MRTLVITSCTGEKLYHPSNQLMRSDFEDDALLVTREKELSEYSTRAGEIYTGMQHQRLMEGIKNLRTSFGDDVVDLYIVSAGYGLIPESKSVVPYEVTFNTMNGTTIAEWSKKIGIHDALNELIPKYDLIFFLLGDKYLKAISPPLENAKEDQKLLFFASGTSKKMIPAKEPYFFIQVGQEEAKSFSYGLIGLKGYLFKLLAEEMKQSSGTLFDSIYQNPDTVMETLEKYRKVK